MAIGSDMAISKSDPNFLSIPEPEKYMKMKSRTRSEGFRIGFGYIRNPNFFVGWMWIYPKSEIRYPKSGTRNSKSKPKFEFIDPYQLIFKYTNIP